jgi:hypothetical protein
MVPVTIAGLLFMVQDGLNLRGVSKGDIGMDGGARS